MIKNGKNMALVIALMLAVFMSSCSNSPKYADMLPDDSAVLVRLDLKQMAEQANYEKSALKDKMLNVISGENMSAEKKQCIKDIVENPEEIGIDLRVPLLISVSAEGNTTLLAQMHDADKYKKVVEVANDESKDKGVKEKDGVYCTYYNGNLMAFNDDVMVVTELKGKTEDEAVEYAVSLLTGKENTKMAERDDVKKLFSADGIMQMLILGEGVASTPNFKAMADKLPKGLSIKDISYFLNLTSKKGSATLSYEVLTESKEWKEFISKGDKMMRPITADLLEYTSKNGFAMMANCSGKEILDYMQNNNLLDGLNAKQLDVIKPLLKSLEGNIVMGISELDERSFTPAMGLYAQTTDESFCNLLKDAFGRIANVGIKDNVTYVTMADNTEPMKPAANKFEKGDVKGSFYCYLNFDLLKPIAAKLRGGEALAMKTMADTFFTAELSYLGEGKAELTFNMRDTDKYPLEKLSKIVLENLN